MFQVGSWSLQGIWARQGRTCRWMGMAQQSLLEQPTYCAGPGTGISPEKILVSSEGRRVVNVLEATLNIDGV